MTVDLGNGVAIARLLGDNGTDVVGYLYLWESGSLAVMWQCEDRHICFVDRPLNAQILLKARTSNSARLAEILEGLPVIPKELNEQD